MNVILINRYWGMSKLKFHIGIYLQKHYSCTPLSYLNIPKIACSHNDVLAVIFVLFTVVHEFHSEMYLHILKNNSVVCDIPYNSQNYFVFKY